MWDRFMDFIVKSENGKPVNQPFSFDDRDGTIVAGTDINPALPRFHENHDEQVELVNGYLKQNGYATLTEEQINRYATTKQNADGKTEWEQIAYHVFLITHYQEAVQDNIVIDETGISVQ